MHIAIVGGGASGALALIHLTRILKSSVSLTLFESETIGQGHAYSTPFLHHILNVPASNMSALPDDPEHFIRWLQIAKPNYCQNQFDLAKSFVPRRWYGEYLYETCQATLDEHPNLSYQQVREKVISLKRQTNGYTLETNAQEAYQADLVILALGNPEPDKNPNILISSQEEHRYIHNPWNYEKVNDMGSKDTVIIQGLGLTMADMILSLEANDFEGKVVVYSRSGRLPLPHLNHPKPHIDIEAFPSFPLSLKFLVKFMRHQAKSCVKKGGAWQEVIDFYKNDYTPCWQQLSLVEQKRFLRHLNTFWNIHRHRLPSFVLDKIKLWEKVGRLSITSGRLKSGKIQDNKVTIQLNNQTLVGDWFVNCSGPSYGYEKSEEPLVKHLLEADLASSHSTGLGFQITRFGELLNSHNQVVKNLFSVGPPTKGQLWEITSVPTIRMQTQAIANQISANALSEYA